MIIFFLSGGRWGGGGNKEDIELFIVPENVISPCPSHFRADQLYCYYNFSHIGATFSLLQVAGMHQQNESRLL